MPRGMPSGLGTRSCSAVFWCGVAVVVAGTVVGGCSSGGTTAPGAEGLGSGAGPTRSRQINALDVAGVIGVARHLAHWMQRDLGTATGLSAACSAQKQRLLGRREQLLTQAERLHAMNEAYTSGGPFEYGEIEQAAVELDSETESLREAWKRFNADCREP